MYKTARIAGLLLLLCGSAEAAWVKEGTSEADAKRDNSECKRNATADAAFNSPQPRPGLGPSTGTRAGNYSARQRQAFQLCMKSKGYVEVPKK